MTHPKLQIVKRDGRDPELLCNSETGEIILIVHPAIGKETWLISFASEESPWKAFLTYEQAMANAQAEFANLIGTED